MKNSLSWDDFEPIVLFFVSTDLNFFSEEEKELTLKIEKLLRYLNLDLFDKEREEFLAKLSLLWNIVEKHTFSTWLYVDFIKHKAKKWIIYFEGKDAFICLKLHKENVETAKELCEYYLRLINQFEMDEINSSIERYRKLVLDSFSKIKGIS